MCSINSPSRWLNKEIEMIDKLKSVGLICFIFAAPVMVSVLTPEFATSSLTFAAEKKEPKYKDVKTRKRASVGKTCAKALDRVRGEKSPIAEAGDAEESVDVSPLFRKAKEMLDDIDASTKKCSSEYEKTQVWSTLGYVLFALDDIPAATTYYRKIVDSDGAEPEFKLDVRLTLGGFYAAQEKYELAIEQYELWADKAFVIGASQRLAMAQIYYQLDRKDDSLRTVKLGIADAEAKGILPKERFWALEATLYFEKDDLKMVTTTLQKLVKHYPKWKYWKQLGGMYGAQERSMDQLVAYEVAYLNGQLVKESDVVSMAYMYLGAEVPYRAAKILEKGIKEGIVEDNFKHLDLLGNAWYLAQNIPQALNAFEGASKYSDTGEIQYRIASTYLDLGQDKKAYKASLKAEKKGGVKKPHANYGKMGNALLNLHCYKDAVTAFNKAVRAAKTKKDKRFPQQWIKFAKYEGNRLQRLRDVGATVPSCSK